MKAKSPQGLLWLAKSLFEANEDLNLILVGGLVAQEIYASRRIRRTSDIDILTTREKAEIFVKRMRENGYETFYNDILDKYSVYKHEEGIHIDVYPGKIGKYSIERIRRLRKMGEFLVVSPEDLIGIKLYAYLVAERGRNKHMIDIYAIIIGKEELDLDYLLNDVIPYVSKITDIGVEKLLETICSADYGALNQFTSKEKRFIKEECNRMLDYFRRIKGFKNLTLPTTFFLFF